MKKILITILSLFIISCGSTTNIDVIVTDSIIDKSDGFSIVYIDDGANVFITGSRSLITITQDSVLGDVTISGSNNLITFQSNVTLKKLIFTGSDNTLNVPIGSNIVASSDTGSGNLIIEQ